MSETDSQRTAEQSSPSSVAGDRENYPDGSEWLHLWAEPFRGSDRMFLAIQWEHVGIAISEVQSILMPRTAVGELLTILKTLPGNRHDVIGVSVRLHKRGG